jgi:hypothetical protein
MSSVRERDACLFLFEKCEVAKSEDVILFYANPKKLGLDTLNNFCLFFFSPSSFVRAPHIEIIERYEKRRLLGGRARVLLRGGKHRGGRDDEMEEKW